MNILPSVQCLRDFGTAEELKTMDLALGQELIDRILRSAATDQSWMALMELFGAWPNETEVCGWVSYVTASKGHWPWRMRESYLGQPHTRGEKGCVFELVGYLYIDRVEDLYGYKLKEWSQNPAWRNLRGLGLSKMEAPFESIGQMIANPHLAELEELKLTNMTGIDSHMKNALGGAKQSKISCLGFLSCDLTHRGIVTLADMAISNSVQHLMVPGNFVSAHEFADLLESGRFPCLETLDVSYSQTTAASLQTLKDRAGKSALKTIKITHTPAAAKLDAEVFSL